MPHNSEKQTAASSWSTIGIRFLHIWVFGYDFPLAVGPNAQIAHRQIKLMIFKILLILFLEQRNRPEMFLLSFSFIEPWLAGHSDLRASSITAAPKGFSFFSPIISLYRASAVMDITTGRMSLLWLLMGWDHPHTHILRQKKSIKMPREQEGEAEGLNNQAFGGCRCYYALGPDALDVCQPTNWGICYCVLRIAAAPASLNRILRLKTLKGR